MPRTTPDWEPEKNFIGFLDETGLLDPDSESADMLVDHLGAIEKQFRHNMADASRYSFGKRLWTTATAEGVRLDDRASVESFMADFNALSQAPQAPALMSGPDQGATGSSHRGRGARVRSGARAGGPKGHAVQNPQLGVPGRTCTTTRFLFTSGPDQARPSELNSPDLVRGKHQLPHRLKVLVYGFGESNDS
jgi:hypothetical protein